MSDLTPQAAIAAVKARFPEITEDGVEFRGDYCLSVPSRLIKDVCLFLKHDCKFEMLSDLCGLDDPDREPRFGIDYNLYSFTHRCRLRLRTAVPSNHPELDSVTSVWKGADWPERETFDMYGVRFTGHPNLTRILMWDGYPFHPLRKDFPLAGLPAELPSTAVDAGSVNSAPMAGGPFVAGHGTSDTRRREPRQYDTMEEQGDKLSKPMRKETV